MITEQEILDLGFVKQDISTDTEGVYQYVIERQDLSKVIDFYPSHIYNMYWDFGSNFNIKGYFKRPNTEGVKTRQTKTLSIISTDIDELAAKLEIIIKSDTNNYSASLKPY